jgi:hypothetical protein
MKSQAREVLFRSQPQSVAGGSVLAFAWRLNLLHSSQVRNAASDSRRHH